MLLREIVADVSLCARIPKGFFKDSLFVWFPIKAPDGICVDGYVAVYRDSFSEKLYPAPTLQEIIWEDTELPLQGNANLAL